MPKLLLMLSCWSLLTLAATPTCTAAPFDLDLHELNKPFTPQRKIKKKPAETPTVARKQRTKSSKAASLLKPALKAATEAAPPPIAELSLKAGNSCLLAENMAVALGRAVPIESLLNGLDLHPVAAVQAGDGGLLITCGLPTAEAYTYQRLLEEHNVQLMNVADTDSATKVAQELIRHLGLACSQETDGTATDGDLIYQCPATGELQQRPLRLILQPTSQND